MIRSQQTAAFAFVTAPLRSRLIAGLQCLAVALALAFAGSAATMPTAASAVVLPAGFQDETVFDGLAEPTTFRFAPDGRVFVAEKQGLILVFDSLQDPTPTVFADLRTEAYDNGDRGILGMVLDPHFEQNQYVYVLYTYDHLLGEAAPAPKWGTPNQAGDPCPKPEDADVDACPVSGRLVRLTADGDRATEELVEGEDRPEERVLVEGWCQQFSSHSIGDLQFGPEGALFASGGDGASFNAADYGQFGWPEKNQCGDPPGQVGEELHPPTAEGGALRSQNTSNLNGKVIRIDPATGDGLPGNPMYGSSNANQRRMIAYGLRNPFRFAIDPESQELYIGNVGWNSYEEIDRVSTVPSVAYNSGWPCYEGPIQTGGYQLGLNICDQLYNNPGSTAPPLFSFSHTLPVTPEDTCHIGSGSAIAGLDIYDGDGFPPAYKGALFFSDFVRGCIYVMFPGDDDRPDPGSTVPFLTSGGVYPGIDVQEGPEGGLYYAKFFSESYGLGSIHRISYSPGNQPPIAHLKADHEWSVGNLSVEFDATESTDADGEPLEYEWDPDGSGIFGAPTTDATINDVYTDSANHTVAVRVKDEKGATSIARLTVYPHDTPPEPEIISPTESSPGSGKADLEYHVGEPIHLEGAAEHEGQPLPSTSLDWDSHIYHCPSECHVHPLQAFPAVASGTLIAPDHDYPSLIELTLTATDSRGLEARKTLKLYPHPIGMTVDSEPSGIVLTAGPLNQTSPFPLTAIEGSSVTLAAPATAQVGGITYAWHSWSDGGDRVHTIVASPSTTSLTAEYSGPPIITPPTEPEKRPPVEEIPTILPPVIALQKHPRKRTRSSTARFTFSAIGASSFRCKRDGSAYRECRSPQTYRHLRPGRHVFKIEAVDSQGNAYDNPATFSWKVLPKPRSG